MTTATRYLLECRCGKSLAVDAGQAGRSVRCECGAALDVPPMRQLVHLPSADAAADQRPLWTARQGLVFLGLVILVGAATFCGYLAWKYPQLDEVQIRREVDDLTLSEAWRNWLAYYGGVFAQSTVDATAVLEERKSINTWLVVGLSVAGAGAAIVVAGLASGRARPPRQK